MAREAAAKQTLFALRREVARIEGTLAERLVLPPLPGGLPIRRSGIVSVSSPPTIPTGVPRLDERLNGGLPEAALTEIHGTGTRDTGAVTGFAFALASLVLQRGASEGPVFWIGTEDGFHEGGFPYAPALLEDYGLLPEKIILSRTRKVEDALWAAGEAARLKAISTLIIEIRGNPVRLDLTVTRRLQRRAALAGRPVFLLRQSSGAGANEAGTSGAAPTAAPVRLLLSPAPAGLRQTVSGPLPGAIGPPAFRVRIDKNRNGRFGEFLLEWNPDTHSFHERPSGHGAENNGIVVSPSRDRPDHAPAAGALMAFGEAGGAASRGEPAGEQHATHRGSRRAG
jgi:protein ImuA